MSSVGVNLAVGNNYALAENTSRAILLYIYLAAKAVIIAGNSLTGTSRDPCGAGPTGYDPDSFDARSPRRGELDASA
jgi:hypothetical protein